MFKGAYTEIPESQKVGPDQFAQEALAFARGPSMRQEASDELSDFDLSGISVEVLGQQIVGLRKTIKKLQGDNPNVVRRGDFQKITFARTFIGKIETELASRKAKTREKVDQTIDFKYFPVWQVNTGPAQHGISGSRLKYTV